MHAYYILSTLIAMHSFVIIILLKRGSLETIHMHFLGCIRMIIYTLKRRKKKKKKKNLR